MRSALRPLAGLFLSAALGGGIVLVLAPAGCGSEAVGIDACRAIENARCEGSRACGFEDAQVTACTLFYRDQCLVGIENADAGTPAENAVTACTTAIQAAAVCAKAGAKTIDGCAGAKLLDGADHGLSPCQVIQSAVAALQACSFVGAPPAVVVPDAGSDAADGSTDGG